MDLTAYKEQLAKGETVDFFFKKCTLISLIFQRLLGHPAPKVVSLNKESIILYDLSFSALLGKDAPCTSIPWTDILRLGMDTGGSQDVIVVQCIPPAIEKVRQHQKQVPGNLLRTYDITKELIILNSGMWLDVPLAEVASLLQDVHQAATAAQK